MSLEIVTSDHVPPERTGNKADLANWFGVALTTVDQWLRRGCPYLQRGERGKQWKFDFLAVSKWRYGAEEKDEDDPEKMPAKERLDWYRGTRERTRHLQECGELLLATDYERELSNAAKIVGTVLESLPDRAERDAGASPEVVELIQHVVDQLREELYHRLSKSA